MTYNSTIPQKRGICPDCPEDSKEKPLIAGRCETHYWAHRSEMRAKKGSGRVSAHTTDYAARKAPKKKIEGLGQWYLDRREEMTGICIETGKPTSKFSDAFFTFSICHILPKSLFPSVALHTDNWIELHVDSHTKFDHSWDDASKMKCFAEAKRKFQLFQHLIAPEERRRIPYQLLQ